MAKILSSCTDAAKKRQADLTELNLLAFVRRITPPFAICVSLNWSACAKLSSQGLSDTVAVTTYTMTITTLPTGVTTFTKRVTTLPKQEITFTTVITTLPAIDITFTTVITTLPTIDITYTPRVAIMPKVDI